MPTIFNCCTNVEKFFNEITNNIDKEIKNLSILDINKKGKDVIAKELYEKYEIKDLVKIDFENFEILVEEISEDKIYNANGIYFEYKIPYTGNKKLLCYQPKSCYMSPMGNDKVDRITDTNIVLKVFITFKEMEDNNNNYNSLVKTKVRNNISFIKHDLEYLNKDIINFNKSLFHSIEISLSDYYIKYKNKLDIMGSINLNPIVKETAPNIQPIKLDLIETKVNNLKMYYIDNNTYQNIINIIDTMGIAMEKTAYSFKNLGEENLRDLFLVILNSHYKNKATGETFRHRGKTDILIESETNDAYIAECKLWAGEKLISTTITQLCSYKTWRDSKTSIIFFNKKNKNFKNLLNTIDKFFNEKKDKRIVSFVKEKENCWKCKLKTKDSTIIDLHFVIYDLYTNDNIKD